LWESWRGDGGESSRFGAIDRGRGEKGKKESKGRAGPVSQHPYHHAKRGTSERESGDPAGGA